ncbi:UNVERIFIED_CONTAM: hypothetical protein FKN15_003800 [Acipenser sinensis]
MESTGRNPARPSFSKPSREASGSAPEAGRSQEERTSFMRERGAIACVQKTDQCGSAAGIQETCRKAAARSISAETELDNGGTLASEGKPRASFQHECKGNTIDSIRLEKLFSINMLSSTQRSYRTILRRKKRNGFLRMTVLIPQSAGLSASSQEGAYRQL